MRIFQLPNFKTDILGRSDPLKSMQSEQQTRTPILGKQPHKRVVSERKRWWDFPRQLRNFLLYVFSYGPCSFSLWLGSMNANCALCATVPRRWTPAQTGLRQVVPSWIGKCERAGRPGEVGTSQSSAFPYTWAGQRAVREPIGIEGPQNTWCNLPICPCSAAVVEARKLNVGGHLDKLIARPSNERHRGNTNTQSRFRFKCVKVTEMRCCWSAELRWRVPRTGVYAILYLINNLDLFPSQVWL